MAQMRENLRSISFFPFLHPRLGSLNVRCTRKFRLALTIDHLLGPIFAAQLAVRGSGLAVGRRGDLHKLSRASKMRTNRLSRSDRVGISLALL